MRPDVRSSGCRVLSRETSVRAPLTSQATNAYQHVLTVIQIRARASTVPGSGAWGGTNCGKNDLWMPPIRPTHLLGLWFSMEICWRWSSGDS
jgi:hypothetical protein